VLTSDCTLFALWATEEALSFSAAEFLCFVWVRSRFFVLLSSLFCLSVNVNKMQKRKIILRFCITTCLFSSSFDLRQLCSSMVAVAARLRR